MQLGITFPQIEIGSDPFAIRDFAQAANELGYSHMVIYEHVMAPGPSHPESMQESRQMFHEPLVLFGYVAALTQMELVTEVLVLPQRQTALVAKQAAEIDILTSGKLRLGVGIGWNPVEYEALGMPFQKRAYCFEEQIQVMRLLWSQEAVTYQGQFHTITDAGLNPLPVQRPIPVWMGGHADAALRRIARLGDGWFPLGKPEERADLVERMHCYIQEAGRDLDSVGLQARVSMRDGNLDEQVRLTEGWRKLGATHLAFNTIATGLKSVNEHIEAMRQYKEAVTA